MRITVSKRRRNKLREINQELKRRMHQPIPQQGQWLRSVVLGHMRYYAVPTNRDGLASFIKESRRLWLMALRRRSQKARRMTWDRFALLAARWMPDIRIMHPYPEQRFAAIHPR